MRYASEARREVSKLHLGLLLFVLFLISGWTTWKEFRYALWGRTVTATATRVYEGREITGKRPRTVLRVEVDYAAPDGTPQTDRLTTSPRRQIAGGQQIEVRYVPGVPRMIRLPADANVFAVVLFCGSLLTIVGFFVWLVREANRPIGRRPRAVDDAPVQAKVVGAAKRPARKSLKPLQPLDEE